MSSETTSTPPRAERILVVDDNERNAAVVEAHLASAGYSVKMVGGGAEALEYFKIEPPDLVLLDVLMPEMDGFETCKRLRATPGGKDTPIVVFTVLGDLSTHQKALEFGADDFLPKPINRTELLIRVRTMLWLKRLRDEVQRGYDVIAKQRDALLHSQQQKEQLISFVVHDLKNPLTSILAHTDYLVAAPSSNPDALEAFRNISGAAQSMYRMVMNLLDISRSEDGALRPQKTSIKAQDLVKEVFAQMNRRAEFRGQKLASTVDPATPLLSADPELIRRVLENLVDNALRYTPQGGTVSIDVKPDGHGVQLRVQDDGPGIPEADKARVFERYVQLDRAPRPTSHGLGLTFCRLAVVAHGGKIWVEDAKPKGSCFCISLPPPA